jgi:hypothetical protein
MRGAWPRAAATTSPRRAPLGEPPRGEGHDRGGMPVRVIVATAGYCEHSALWAD